MYTVNYLRNIDLTPCGLVKITSLKCKVFGKILASYDHFDGLMQDSSNSIANALEILQYCIKPLIYNSVQHADTNTLS